MKIIQKNKIYLFFPLDKFNVRHKVENNNMNNGQKKKIFNKRIGKIQQMRKKNNY